MHKLPIYLRRIFLPLLAALFFAPFALAGSEGVAISPLKWRAMTNGKTVYYSIAGEFYGREYYVPGTNTVYFEHRDGTCLIGEWSYAAPWYSFTFFFDGYQLAPYRFLHRQIADTIVIVSDDPDMPRQQVSRIVTAPFTCAADVTS